MVLFEKINQDIKTAMMAREKDKLEALRAVKSAFLIAKTEKGATAELSDEDEIKIIIKLVKQRKDSAEIYRTQNREDLYTKEEFEADIISQYLPKQMSEDEIIPVLKNIIETLGVKTPAEMGKVMGMASKQLAGKADNKVISDLVKRLLTT
ncbi:MAG: glutamyl-tRNA amidotransferase [Bacteroidetes bacterium HGW-Bacteroidetes-21]|jgi:hypothetical protein|nr:MAG: glutamyl-tRNA amidotransferase [Bacteroidetes bacterium HGW-Bacteroidetes-21]